MWNWKKEEGTINIFKYTYFLCSSSFTCGIISTSISLTFRVFFFSPTFTYWGLVPTLKLRLVFHYCKQKHLRSLRIQTAVPWKWTIVLQNFQGTTVMLISPNMPASLSQTCQFNISAWKPLTGFSFTSSGVNYKIMAHLSSSSHHERLKTMWLSIFLFFKSLKVDHPSHGFKTIYTHVNKLCKVEF